MDFPGKTRTAQIEYSNTPTPSKQLIWEYRPPPPPLPPPPPPPPPPPNTHTRTSKMDITSMGDTKGYAFNTHPLLMNHFFQSRLFINNFDI